MAIYNNTNRASDITTVEAMPVASGNSTFVHLKAGADVEAVKQWLTQDLGQKIDAQTQSGKETILVTHGDKSQVHMQEAFAAHGDTLQAAPPEKAKFKPWVWRGNISIVGQSLQLASGILLATELAKANPAKLAKALKAGKVPVAGKGGDYIKMGMDMPVVIFAASNLLANFSNIIFGAQKTPDTHQLKYLKQKTNDIMAPHVAEGAQLPGIDEKRAQNRKEPAKPKTAGQKAYNFLQKNSVSIGEIGLRYFGAFALAFPADKWKDAGKALGKMHFNEALKKGFNSNKFTGYTGVAYLVGKTLALTTKVPDPYDKTHKHTTMDTIREKFVFPASSAIEAVAAGLLAYNGIMKKKVIIGGKVMRDYPGGIGGMLFMSGLVIRMFAPFGAKVLDKEELNAHISDGLAKIPPEKLPQVVADTAAFLTDHYKKQGQNPEYSKIYSQLTHELYRDHHIALAGPGGAAAAPQMAAVAPESEKTKTFARPELKKEAPVIPMGSFTDKVSVASDNVAQRA